MLGIPVGWAYAHVLEWGLHKHLMHKVSGFQDIYQGFGRSGGSKFLERRDCQRLHDWILVLQQGKEALDGV